MEGIDVQYIDIAKSILENGVDKGDRTGIGTKSIFSAQIKHDMKEGFPLLTTKRVYWKGVVTELLWFLRGDTNIKYLVDNGCNIWNGDAYKAYQSGFKEKHHLKPTSTKEEFIERIKTDDEFAKKWGDLGPIYGKQWRDWGGEFSSGHWNSKKNKLGRYFGGVDQIQQAITTLKTNPDSRRIIVNAWNVGEIDKMVLPPCHWAFELYTEETDLGKRRLSLKWHQRSVDLPLGLPFNIASYALLLEILSKEVGMIPGTLIGDLTNVHIYNNQIEGIREQITRTPKHLPELVLRDEFWDICDKEMGMNEKINAYEPEWFTIENYIPHSAIKIPLSN